MMLRRPNCPVELKVKLIVEVVTGADMSSRRPAF
jgi:hypothetical protein